MIRKVQGLAVLFAVLLVAAACSGTQFGYRFLDNLMRWQLNEYVTLYGQQSSKMDEVLDQFHNWHQREQLPLYAAFIEERMALLRAPAITVPQLQQTQDKMTRLWQLSAAELLPEVRQLLNSLSSEQRTQMIQAMTEKDQEYREEHIELPLAERKKSYRKRMLKQLDKWLGSVDQAQLKKMDAWVAALDYDTTARVAQRKRVRAQLFDWVSTSALSAAQWQQFRQLMLNPESSWLPVYRQYLTANQQKTFGFLVDLHQSLSDRQKQHLLKKLERYRTDFLKLGQES